jgi:hypothetical protein
VPKPSISSGKLIASEINAAAFLSIQWEFGSATQNEKWWSNLASFAKNGR